MKYEILLKGESFRSESTQVVTREKLRTNTNSIVVNNVTRPKPEGCLVADVQKGKRKVQCCTIHSIRT